MYKAFYFFFPIHKYYPGNKSTKKKKKVFPSFVIDDYLLFGSVCSNLKEDLLVWPLPEPELK